ncbi:MAG: hypothetical protein GX663_02710 [Clostridiales bacterium]|nr:hypothetical protein [Clostridiales bacterium]
MEKIEAKRIDVLYTLLQRAEEAGDKEIISALRWAILSLEQKQRKG